MRGLAFGWPLESNVGTFSVEISPLDSMTTKRPLADISPAKESPPEFVTWLTKKSGVELAGDCAVVSALPTSIQAAAAHKKAITSLIIKNMNERSKCSLGI